MSSLLHGRLWQPYQRRCLRGDSRKLPACAGRAAPSWRAILCPEFAREKPALYTLRARCALCVVRVGKRVATCLCRHFCLLRGLTPATHLILWQGRWFHPRRPVILYGARGPLGCPFQRILFASVTGCDICYSRLPSGRFVGPPRPAIAACVSCRAGVERSPPVHKSADTGASGCSVRDTYEEDTSFANVGAREPQETGLRSAAKWEGTTHGGEREIEVRQNGDVSIRSCFCVSPES